MHQNLESLAIILGSSFTVYCLYLVYLRITKSDRIKDLIPEDKINEYNKIKNKHMMIFIIGLLIGFVIILVKDHKVIKNIVNMKVLSELKNISDVDDISVL